MRNLFEKGPGKWKRFTLVLGLQFFTIMLIAQVRITGRVTGPDGKAVPAISVQVRNTTIGTITDAEGN